MKEAVTFFRRLECLLLRVSNGKITQIKET